MVTSLASWSSELRLACGALRHEDSTAASFAVSYTLKCPPDCPPDRFSKEISVTSLAGGDRFGDSLQARCRFAVRRRVWALCSPYLATPRRGSASSFLLRHRCDACRHGSPTGSSVELLRGASTRGRAKRDERIQE